MSEGSCLENSGLRSALNRLKHCVGAPHNTLLAALPSLNLISSDSREHDILRHWNRAVHIRDAEVHEQVGEVPDCTDFSPIKSWSVKNWAFLIFVLFVTKIGTLYNFSLFWLAASTWGRARIGWITLGSHSSALIDDSTQTELIRVFTAIFFFFFILFIIVVISRTKQPFNFGYQMNFNEFPFFM